MVTLCIRSELLGEPQLLPGILVYLLKGSGYFHIQSTVVWVINDT